MTITRVNWFVAGWCAGLAFVHALAGDWATVAVDLGLSAANLAWVWFLYRSLNRAAMTDRSV